MYCHVGLESSSGVHWFHRHVVTGAGAPVGLSSRYLAVHCSRRGGTGHCGRVHPGRSRARVLRHLRVEQDHFLGFDGTRTPRLYDGQQEPLRRGCEGSACGTTRACGQIQCAIRSRLTAQSRSSFSAPAADRTHCEFQPGQSRTDDGLSRRLIGAPREWGAASRERPVAPPQ